MGISHSGHCGPPFRCLTIRDLLYNNFSTAISKFCPVGDSTESATALKNFFNVYSVYASKIFSSPRLKFENLVTKIIVQ